MGHLGSTSTTSPPHLKGSSRMPALCAIEQHLAQSKTPEVLMTEAASGPCQS
jgi:hypothetical protein